MPLSNGTMYTRTDGLLIVQDRDVYADDQTSCSVSVPTHASIYMYIYHAQSLLHTMLFMQKSAPACNRGPNAPCSGVQRHNQGPPGKVTKPLTSVDGQYMGQLLSCKVTTGQ